MNNLYDISLFNRKFNIDGNVYRLLLQIKLKIQADHWETVFVLCEDKYKNSLLMVAWSNERKTLIPILNEELSDIIRVIKLMPFPDKYKKYQNVFDALAEKMRHSIRIRNL